MARRTVLYSQFKTGEILRMMELILQTAWGETLTKSFGDTITPNNNNDQEIDHQLLNDRTHSYLQQQIDLRAYNWSRLDFR